MIASPPARPLARLLVLATLPMLATACGDKGASRFPSLLPRAIESRSDAEPVVAPVVVAPDPALDTQAAEATAALGGNAKDFAIALTKADAAAKLAQGDKVGGERWIDAQTALAELDVYRAQSQSLLTDLEQLAIGRAADGKPDYPVLETARAAAQAELDRETAEIRRIQASMPEA